ncbi:hypothetical protein BC829DRAFT_444759 [Chytridium lagenaria]|nr:hypothetical protein BC829DRAFT_444759 [Chytridium lagenaria]
MPSLTPTSNATVSISKASYHVGIIGMGDMGRLYARRISAAGYSVHVCDLPQNYETLKSDFGASPNVTVHVDGFHVSRRCDYVIYSVEASSLDKVVGMYGPATKVGAVVGGQTSVKEPEIKAFERYLPDDVGIVTAHSMHGPNVDPTTQAMVVIRHRADEERFERVREVLRSLGSQMVYLTQKEHDDITADTQAVTHAAFLSMGHAWASSGNYPWENQVNGIDSVKIHLTLRIFSNKWHVYAGLAILNPSARIQIRQYSRSVSELFALMIQHRHEEFTRRVMEAGHHVFGLERSESTATLLSKELIDDFAKSMGGGGEEGMGMNPYDHLVCNTPVFGLWIGITEHLFLTPHLLTSAIHASLTSLTTRAVDMQFVTSVAGWCECIEQGNFEAYRDRFEKVQGFFKGRDGGTREKGRCGNGWWEWGMG